MSPRNHALVTTRNASHCTKNGCRKCIARSHWLRRKAWRTHKSPVRRSHGRK
jgi:hypothetical protein